MSTYRILFVFVSISVFLAGGEGRVQVGGELGKQKNKNGLGGQTKGKKGG